ncbi:MAG TPA: AI-2E family transporter [Anaerolineales bacterium]|nr:AI-2E family transporter [Anaerolineales bacterium]
MNSTSPQWSSSVKLVVGLTIVAIMAALMVRFSNILGPLLMALILAYLLHPLAATISKQSRLSWRVSVNLIYIVFVVLLVSLLTATGVAAIQQIQSLFRVIENFLVTLPQIAEDLSTQVFRIGTYEIDMTVILGQYDLERVLNQVIEIVQPVLGQAGGLIRSIATGTFTTLGWLFFILLVSYFTLADAGHFPDMLSGMFSNIDLPGYQEDLTRIGKELGRIWNAFVRGQLILIAMTAGVILVLLTLLGVRNALALALVAGIARFVPYIGPFVTWVVTGLVAFFQTTNYLGLDQLTYALLVVGVIVLLDQIIDNLITPRLYGQVLGLHPAAVLVAAIIAANLLGLIGLLLAAPVLATLLFFGRYATRKMFDLDPWQELDAAAETDQPERPGLPGLIMVRIKEFLKSKRERDERSNPPTAD